MCTNRRRVLVYAVAGLAAVLCPQALPADGMPRIGFLSMQRSPERLQSFIAGMREFGYVEGKTIAIEWRFTEGKVAPLASFAAELVGLKPDLIVAVEPQSVETVRRLTSTIPIVFVVGQDPVGLGFAKSLARPGGNITGTTSMSTDVGVKQIELFRNTVPNSRRIAVLVNPTNKEGAVLLRKAYEAGGRKFGISMVFSEASTEAEIERAVTAAKEGHADGIVVSPDGFLFQVGGRIAALAIEKHLPSLFFQREAVALGALVSYGADARHQFRRTGYYVHRILKGAKPGDLPIEQPTQFVMAVNLRTAKAIGVEFAPRILSLADEVIQ